MKALGIREVLSAPRSPWQRAYVERVIGTLRRECLDHVIVFSEAALYRHVKSFLAYYHESRTHLSLAKDTKIDEKVTFKFSANFFNAFNNHYLIASQGGNYGGPSVAFHTDVNNSNFGTWNGGVSSPRTIQFAGRVEF